MRTLSEIRSSGRIFQVFGAAMVLLFALAALVAQQHDQRVWLDTTSIAGLMACSGGLMAIAIGAPRLATGLAVVAFLGGAASFDQYEASGWVNGRGGPDASGLLAQVVALSTLLAGLAIAAAAWLRKTRRRVMTVVSVGSVIIALGVAGLIHDVFPGFEATAPTLGLTLWRALLLVFLGAAVVVVGRPGRRRTRTKLARWRFLPMALAVAAGALLLAQLVRVQEIGQMERALETTTQRIQDQLAVKLASSTLGIDRMARSWSWRGRPARNDWKTDAWLFVDHFPEVRVVTWVGPEGRVRWLAPLAGSHVLQNRVLTEAPAFRDALERAREADGLAMSEPVELALGGRGFIVAAPVSPASEFMGHIVGFYRLDALMEGMGAKVAPGYRIELFDDGERIHRSADPAPVAGPRWERRSVFSAYGADWQVRLTPQQQTLERHLTWLPALTLAIGAAIALLVGVAVYQAEVSRLSARRLGYAVQRRARVEAELRRYQRELEDRVAERTADLHEKQRQLERSNAELERLATTDAVTGTCNRRRFMEVAEYELSAARRYGRALSVIMFDLDHFKRINDRFGHQCGDAVLARAAERAGEGLRDTDCLARYGGEEFVVLLVESGREEADAVAERIRDALERLTVEHAGEELRITASFGATSLAGTDRDIDAVLERADRALYEAKGAGRNRAVFLWE